MKVISIAAAGVSLACIALTLLPSAGEYRGAFAIGALIGSLVALATILAGWREAPARAAVTSAPVVPAPVPVPAPRAADPTLAAQASAQAEVIAMLAAFQEKGRLVDFLQDDITAYSDAQVGAAARVVHQGCKAALDDVVSIVPVCDGREGAAVTVPAGYVADEYRLVGKISGHAPFSGTLMHRGWKVQSVNLPRIVHRDDDRLPVVAPAEVELR